MDDGKWNIGFGNEMGHRSITSRQQAYVRFFNKSGRQVELIWINYLGEYNKYRILNEFDYVDINTFKTHPWFALDHLTKERLHIDKSFVYHPRTSREILEERRPGIQIPENYELRVKSYITIPLYSLRYRSLLEIRNCMQEPSDVDSLELPESLANELKAAIRYRNSLRDIPFIS